MYDPRYLQGIDHFNRQEFFEAHDIWEELWREMKGDDSRVFYQGLIQAAVALHHYRNGNFDGAWRMWGFSVERLEGFRPRHEGLDVDNFVAGMRRALGGLQGDPRRPFDGSLCPAIEPPRGDADS
jgi:predicted metal-dependent hydrolase